LALSPGRGNVARPPAGSVAAPSFSPHPNPLPGEKELPLDLRVRSVAAPSFSPHPNPLPQERECRSSPGRVRLWLQASPPHPVLYSGRGNTLDYKFSTRPQRNTMERMGLEREDLTPAASLNRLVLSPLAGLELD